MHFDHQHTSRQPAPADPLRHSRRHILASVLLLLDSDRALADWSLPQLPHVSGFTYKGNRFLVATDKEAEQIVWGWIENNLWAVTNTDEDIELLLQHLQISPSLVEAFNGQAAIHYLRTVHPKKFCKLLSPAIANPTQFVQALFENRSRSRLIKRAICESAQFSPLATTEVERAGYLIYCIINQPEILPGSLKLTINYPYSYKSMKERAKKYLASPASIHERDRIAVVFHSNGMVTVANCLWEWEKIKKFLMHLQRYRLDMRV